jgi:hypothetical protein
LGEKGRLEIATAVLTSSSTINYTKNSRVTQRQIN